MSKKKTALVFAAGAVAGYKIAQRIAGEAQDAPYTPYLAAEPIAAPPVASRTDPFRGAFRESMAAVNLYGAAEDETEVA